MTPLATDNVTDGAVEQWLYNNGNEHCVANRAQ